MRMSAKKSYFAFFSLLAISAAHGEDRFQYILNTNLIQHMDFSTSGGFDPWETETCYNNSGQCKYLDFHTRWMENEANCVDVHLEEHDVVNSDMVALVKNASGTWQKISDDEGTNLMPRFYIEFSGSNWEYAETRIKGYGTSANDDNFILHQTQTLGACPRGVYPTIYVTGPDSEDRTILQTWQQ